MYGKLHKIDQMNNKSEPGGDAQFTLFFFPYSHSPPANANHFDRLSSFQIKIVKL